MYVRIQQLLLISFSFCCVSVVADEAGQSNAVDDTSVKSEETKLPTMPISASASKSTPTTKSAPTPKHALILKDAKPGAPDSLIKTYLSPTNLFAELNDYNSEYIVLISIAKGIGQQPLLGGMSWNFGDDWVWKFRKIGKKVHIIRRNVRFKASKNSPEKRAVSLAYTDSVLFSLPILSKGPKGGDLVDLTPVFMSDLPQISQVLPGFMFSRTKSTWDEVKGFKKNLEIEVAATYASSGRFNLDSVADSRGATINVHYSISKIPMTGYQPRVADDRIGYFLTVQKDYSKKSDQNRFVRYINRWNLKKAEPSEEMSPPKEPIIFYLEKTIPYKYRKPIKDGILEWNKAFAKAGFIDAVEVRQQEDGDTWDPEDIRYNTFRWITASAGFAMGPSRVNPYTGQILDADIIFDSDFLESWKSTFETFTPESVAAMTGGPLDIKSYEEQAARNPFGLDRCQLSDGMSRQMAFGKAAIIAKTADNAAKQKELQEKLIMQGLKEVAMHEVGHTLGLRHNFKASTFLTLDEANDLERTSKVGTTASVMDYTPANLAAKGKEQGDFYSTTIGPYDYWAIEYGYKPLSGGTKGEVGELKKIAARSGEPGHAFATDQDTRGISPDPYVNRFDLGKDPMEYAKQQAKLVSDLMPGLVDRMVSEGEDYSQARRAFNILLARHGQATFFAARFIGGIDESRSHKGDKDGAPPFKVIDAATQREAMNLISEQVFGVEPYSVKPELYNLLAPSRWSHWGASSPTRPDFPAHDYVAMWQSRVLSQLLSSLTLERLHDSELKVAADQDAFTTAELLEKLTKAIFQELDNLEDREYTNRKPAINSLRRNLQRIYLSRLGNIAMSNTFAPEDCQAVAYMILDDLKGKLEKVSEKDGLDLYTKAHLKASRDRINKVLDASLTLYSP